MNKLLDVTKDNYFEDTGHLSNSKFKRFLECEVKGLEPFGEPSTAMKVGSYVDSYVEGTLGEFRENNRDIFYKNDATRLKADFRQAEEICEFIDNDNTIQQFLSGKKQEIFTGEIGDAPFKAMLDVYSEGIAINDLKILRGITRRDGSYFDFITQWGYQYQGAIYQELVYQNTGERLPFFLVVVTKEEPINSAIVNIDQHTLDLALHEVEENALRFHRVNIGEEEPIGCGTCSSCIKVRKETPIISIADLQKEEINF